VDRHALRAVDLLHLGHQVQLHLARAEDAQHLVRVDRTDVQLVADRDVVALLEQQAGALGHDVGDLLEPSSGVIVTWRPLAVSSRLIRPSTSEICATPLGCGPRTAPPRAAGRG
jgi:hypothetical protein